jgi:hypothetical protein
MGLLGIGGCNELREGIDGCDESVDAAELSREWINAGMTFWFEEEGMIFCKGLVDE